MSTKFANGDFYFFKISTNILTSRYEFLRIEIQVLLRCYPSISTPLPYIPHLSSGHPSHPTVGITYLLHELPCYRLLPITKLYRTFLQMPNFVHAIKKSDQYLTFVLVISCFRRGVNEIFALQPYYVV